MKISQNGILWDISITVTSNPNLSAKETVDTIPRAELCFTIPRAKAVQRAVCVMRVISRLRATAIAFIMCCFL